MTKLVLLTGYLGSGKTTTLKHVLTHLPEHVQTAVIINEYAAAGIDGKIIDHKRYTVKELENGCICCSRGRDLKAQIEYLKKTHSPDIILVETTGVAEPEPLLDIIEETKTPIHAVVVVIDAYQYSKKRVLGDVSQRQIRLANLVLLNKQDLVSTDIIDALTDNVHTLNKDATVCSAAHGQLSAKQLLSVAPPRLTERKKARRVHGHNTTSLSLTTTSIVSLKALEALLSALPADVARAKGIVRTARGYRLFQYAAGLYTIEPAQPPKDKTGVFVFLGPLSMKTRLSLAKHVHALSKGGAKELFSYASCVFKSLD